MSLRTSGSLLILSGPPWSASACKSCSRARSGGGAWICSMYRCRGGGTQLRVPYPLGTGVHAKHRFWRRCRDLAAGLRIPRGTSMKRCDAARHWWLCCNVSEAHHRRRQDNRPDSFCLLRGGLLPRISPRQAKPYPPCSSQASGSSFRAKDLGPSSMGCYVGSVRSG